MSVNIRVLKFYQKIIPSKKDGVETGEVEFEDWVTWCPTGQANTSTNNEPIRHLKRAIPNDQLNEAVTGSEWDKWQYIKPLYEAWKSNEELPVEGTPLAIWTAIRPEFLEVFKKAGFKTVEEVRDMVDADIERIRLPGVRELRMQAKRFIDAHDQNKAAALMKARDDDIAALREEVAAMKAERATVAEGPRPFEPVPKEYQEPPKPKAKGWPKGKKREKRQMLGTPMVQKGRLVQSEPEPVQEDAT